MKSYFLRKAALFAVLSQAWPADKELAPPQQRRADPCKATGWPRGTYAWAKRQRGSSLELLETRRHGLVLVC